MRTWADSTLMSMKKSDLIECLRCAEHNQAVAEERLAQHIENVKEWVPVVRCKDCRYLGRELDKGLYSCDDYNLPYCEPDSYCSHGRRKEETKHAAD